MNRSWWKEPRARTEVYELRLWVQWYRALPDNRDYYKRLLAKALFWLSGWASKVQTPHRTYRLIHAEPGEDFKTEYAGIRWLPCRASMWLLTLSMRLDWWHWSHWAHVHTDCGAEPCLECGGLACSEEDEED